MFRANVEKIISRDDISILRKYQLVELEMLLVVDKICREHKLRYWIDAGTLLGAVRHKGFIPWDDDCDICMPRKDYQQFIEIIKTQLPDGIVYGNKYTNNWVQTHKNGKHGFTQLYYTEQFRGMDVLLNEEHIGAFIDVFPMDHILPEMCENKIYKFINKIVHKERRDLNGLKDYSKQYLQKLNPEKIWINKCNKLEEMNKSEHVVYGIETVFTETRYIQSTKDIFPLSEIEFEGYMLYAPNNYHNYLSRLYGDYMKLPDKEEQHGHLVDLRL